MKYWVYEDRSGVLHAFVHEETCSRCNYGKGMGRGRRQGESEWYGPYDTIEEAFQKACATEQKEVRGCKHCVCKPDASRA